MQPLTIHTICRRRDSRHGVSLLPVDLWQARPAVWRAGVLTAGGALDDLEGVTALRLTVATYGGTRPGSLLWLDAAVEAADFTVPEDAAAVTAGTGWHAEWRLSAEQTFWPVEDGGTRRYWYEIRGVAEAGETVLSAGLVMLRGTPGADLPASGADVSHLQGQLDAVAQVSWPLASLADPRGGVGAWAFNPVSRRRYHKHSISPHAWHSIQTADDSL